MSVGLMIDVGPCLVISYISLEQSGIEGSADMRPAFPPPPFQLGPVSNVSAYMSSLFGVYMTNQGVFSQTQIDRLMEWSIR